MKYLIILLLIPIVSHAQEPTFLKKYSYICFGLDNQNGKIRSGTCYFYKKGTYTVLITNYHVISGINSADSVEYPPIDTLYFSCDSNNMTVTHSITIPKFNLRHDLFYQKTDMIGIGVQLSAGQSVNYINDLIDTAFFDVKPDSVYSYGYPTRLVQTNGKQMTFIAQLLSGKYSSSFSFDFVPQFKLPNDKTGLSESEILTKLRNTEFTISSVGEPGQSGSPIFGRFKVNNKWVYRFVGMLWGAGNTNFPFSMAYNGFTIYQNLTRQ